MKSRFTQEYNGRLVHKDVLRHFCFLDLTTWPLDAQTLETHCINEVTQIFAHWNKQMNELHIKLDRLHTELKMVKAMFLATPQPCDAVLFWKDIISGRHFQSAGKYLSP